ncbi:hypothetical protein D3C71_1084660 [compost metagenome]
MVGSLRLFYCVKIHKEGDNLKQLWNKFESVFDVGADVVSPAKRELKGLVSQCARRLAGHN